MGYLYKSDLLYDTILHGKLYPLLDLNWFGGMQQLRYTGPLPVYLLTVCQFLTGGNVVYAYLLFLGSVVFANGMIWFGIGSLHGRSVVGGYLGIIWLFLPPSLSILLIEGDLGKLLCLLILPILFESILDYYMNSRSSGLVRVMVCFSLIQISSVSFATVILISVGIYLFFSLCVFRSLRETIHIAVSALLGSAWSGFWLLAAYSRVYTQGYHALDFRKYFTGLLMAFNPTTCFSDLFSPGEYLGLSLLLTAIFGVLFARKKSMPSFCTGLLMILAASSAVMPFIILLPFKDKLGMLLYIPVAAALVLTGFLTWNSLKKPFIVLVSLILLLDASLSLYSYRNVPDIAEKEKCEKDYLINEIKAVTNRRALILDHGDAGSMAGYLLSTGEKKVPVITGYEWEDSPIARNYLQLCEALDGDYYAYIFDRALELGNDSVLIKIKAFSGEEIAALDMAAARLGYQMTASGEVCRLYHIDTPETFGIITDYPAIGIGDGTRRSSLGFPGMEETSDPNLNNYSYEELSQYDLIFLADFTYTDKYMAETMIRRLSEDGVRIVIAADGIPMDENTGVQNFLGVTCANVKFSNGFPELDTIDGLIYPALFPKDYRNWTTVYLNGLKDVWGSFQMDHQRLNFYGTAYNDNIIMFGLNLAYHYELTRDPDVGELLSHAMNLASAELPERRLVPLEIIKEKNFIQIETKEDHVNTTLAYQDIFKSAQALENRNQILYVNRGRTVIQLVPPYLWEGIGVSVLGIFLSIAALWIIRIRNSRSSIDVIELTGIRTPVTGDIIKTGSEIKIPENAPYVVESVTWYDCAGRQLREGEKFPAGKNSIQIVLRSLGYSRFHNEIKATLDGKEFEQKTWEQNGVKMTLEQSYEMTTLIAFEHQPRSVATTGTEAVSVAWKLAVAAKLGYLQRLNENEDNWQICGVVESLTGKMLTYTILYDGMDCVKYRLIYILGNGTTIYSEEFEVRWNAECNGQAPLLEAEPENKTEEISVAEPENKAEEISAAEPVEKQHHRAADSEWLSIKDDFDYDFDAYDKGEDNLEQDKWYEELSEKNDRRFENGDLTDMNIEDV